MLYDQRNAFLQLRSSPSSICDHRGPWEKFIEAFCVGVPRPEDTYLFWT